MLVLSSGLAAGLFTLLKAIGGEKGRPVEGEIP